jgi:lysophospholipase L1-like esterase
MDKKKMRFLTVLATALLFIFFVSIQANAQEKRLSCVGNSITAGYGLSNPSKDSYPSQLLGLLGANNWVVGNFGASGRTLLKGGGYSYWDDGQYSNALKSNPNFVVIGLGTNDSKKWLWDWLGASDFKKDYKSLVQSFQNLSTKPDIWIFLLVPGEKADWAIYNTYIDKVNVRIKEVALEMGLGLIDLHSAFDGHWPGWFQPDSVHPTAEGAAEIASKVKEMLLMSKPEIIYTNGKVTSPDGYDYQWYIDGVPVTSENGGKQKQMPATQKGVYKVSLKLYPNSETRIVSKEFNVDVISGIDSKTLINGIKIYPNPAFDLLFVKSDYTHINMTYRINDLSGKEALLGKFESGNGTISIGKLPPGTYLLSFANACVRFVKRY